MWSPIKKKQKAFELLLLQWYSQVAELTEEVAEANKKLEWEKGENGVLKKKHASAIKELNRELHRAVKRSEQLEAKLAQQDATSTRTGEAIYGNIHLTLDRSVYIWSTAG